MTLVRTNVTLPAELMREMDELAGPRGRSAYVAEAVLMKVKRDRLRRALDGARGIFVGTPNALSPDEVLVHIDQLRSDDRDPWRQ